MGVVGQRARVTAEGVTVPAGLTGAVDVLFDGRRIWSFDPVRDAGRGKGERLVRWPKALARRLDGTTPVTVRSHVDGQVLFSGEVAFGSSGRRIELVDDKGAPLTVDKSGKLAREFSGTSGDNLERVLDRVEDVLAFLRDRAGVPAYLCYGGLLGAVRTGHLIGHDSDVDLSYLSAFSHPADIVAESFRIERLFHRSGWETRRMSGNDFKVFAVLDDRSRVGIDVFGSYYVDGVYHLMADVRGELPESALLPLGSVQLEGRTIPAPNDPAALLQLTYGPSWQVPDPAFRFHSPPSTLRRMNGWMQGERVHLRPWENYHAGTSPDTGAEPSDFGRWVAGRLQPDAGVIDLGSGAGRDAVHLAAAGHRVTGFDYCGAALRAARRRARADTSAAVFEELNLYDTRRTLARSALLAHEGWVSGAMTRLLPNTLNHAGRANLWRLGRMVLRPGGRMYVEFVVPRRVDEATPGLPPTVLRPVTRDVIVAEVQASGGHVELDDVVTGRGLADERRTLCRMVVSWS